MASILMHAVQMSAPHQLAIVRVPEVAAGNDVVVRPMFVGICGTDLDLLDGTMPYLARGEARYPLIPGHEWSGVVVEPGGSEFERGQLVVADPVIGCGSCDACATGPATRCEARYEIGVRNGRQGALAERIAVPLTNLHAVPHGVAAADAALAEPAVTAVAAAELLQQQAADENVLVVGAGTIGLLAASALISTGSSVTVLQRSALRRELVESIGASSWVQEEKLQNANARTFTGAIEASGSTEGLRTAVSHLRAGSSIALAGIYPPQDVVDWTDVVLRELRIVGVLNGPGRYPKALQMIADGVLPAGRLVDSVLPVAGVQQAFSRARERGRIRPKVLIDTSRWKAA